MSLAFGADGTLYGVSESISWESELFAVDPLTGQATSIARVDDPADDHDGESVFGVTIAATGTVYANLVGGAVRDRVVRADRPRAGAGGWPSSRPR